MQNTNSLLRSFFLFFLLLIYVEGKAEGYDGQSEYAKVTNISSYMNIRQTPSKSSTIVGKARNHDIVLVWPTSETKDGWVKIQKDNIVGYAKTIYLQKVDNSSKDSNTTHKEESGRSYYLLSIIILISSVIIYMFYDFDNATSKIMQFLLRIGAMILGLVVVRLFMLVPNFLHWIGNETFFGVFDLEGNLMTSEHFGTFIMVIYLFLTPTGWFYLLAAIFGMAAACLGLEKTWSKLIVCAILGLILLGTYDKDYTSMMPFLYEDLCLYLRYSLGFEIRPSADDANWTAFDLSLLAGTIFCVYVKDKM